jgi:hypothetical protein
MARADRTERALGGDPILDDPVTTGSNAAEKCGFWADKNYLAPELGTD